EKSDINYEKKKRNKVYIISKESNQERNNEKSILYANKKRHVSYQSFRKANVKQERNFNEDGCDKQEEYIMKCIRCDTQYQKNVTHCVVCNFPINDPINPNHYTMRKYETIDVILDIVNSLSVDEASLVGNHLMYLSRYPHNNGIEDVKNSHW